MTGPTKENTMSDHDPFADDVLGRLIRSNMEYQREHGYYIVPLSERLLAERQKVAALEAERDKKDAALAYYAERRNYVLPGSDPSCQRHGTDTCEMFHRDAYDGQGPGARARAALAAATPAAEEKVTHGRHCSCSACAREDWTRITGPCGMHGPDCPAVYAPLPGATGER